MSASRWTWASTFDVFVVTMNGMPLTTDLSAWYATTGFAPLLRALAVTVAGFVISLGGRPMLGALTLEE